MGQLHVVVVMAGTHLIENSSMYENSFSLTPNWETVSRVLPPGHHCFPFNVPIGLLTHHKKGKHKKSLSTSNS